MKTRNLFWVLLLLLIGSPTAQGQVDLMDALKQTAQMHNEANPEGEGETNQGTAPEGQNEWQEAWEKKMKEDAELLEALDDKYLSCIALMTLYVHEYVNLEDMAETQQDCKMKYDLYGMQLLALSASTTIMYCPEEMSQLLQRDNQLYERWFNDFIDATQIRNSILAIQLRAKFSSLIGRYGEIESGTEYNELSPFVLDYLIHFFRPEFIVYNTLEIGQKMEALGCSG